MEVSFVPPLSDGTYRSLAGQCVHEAFEMHAALRPDAVALRFGDSVLTYGELNRLANQLAHHLLTRGVGPDVLVGICMHRCIEMVVGILGVLKAGGAYVPLDAAYPAQRLASMVAAVDLAIVLTTEEVAPTLPACDASILCLDSASPDLAAEPDSNPDAAFPTDLAYAIFTSGSTGDAKAAAVYQRGWANLIDWFVTEFEINASDRVLVVSSFSFDITQRAIAMPLAAGGELHLHTTRIYNPESIREAISSGAITLLNCAPSTFYPLVECPSAKWQALETLRAVFLGGEAISASRLRNWASSSHCTEVANVYGVAECSDVSTFHRLRSYDRYVETSVPIGHPIFDTQVYLLDDGLAAVPPGERGEICIAGVGVGKGYVNDPELTAQKFVPDPFTRGAGVLYRTGDIGRALPDGSLELIGRVDHQVKVRGNRIDLGDIETNLRLHPGVREAAVVSRLFGVGDVRLIAYLVASRDGLRDEDLIQSVREFLRHRLPDYMVPARFFVLGQLPLNPNGKVDRGALAARDDLQPVRAVAVGGASSVEERIASAFAEVLGIEGLDAHDNFFFLGGDSYLATVLLGRLTDWDVRLSIIDFLAEPTVAGVAKAISDVQVG